VAFANAGSVMMELIEPLRGPSIYKEFLAEKGEGLHHVHSRHENVREVLQAFKEMGIAVLMSGKYGTGEFYYLDTEPMLGIIYEIVKKKPIISRVSPEATYPP
jgi:4-hydroxyphenylpyruvate dioxygenase-like putative hemolysin